MAFLRNLFTKTSSPAASAKAGGYRCRPDLKAKMMAKHRDLKPAELEALTQLTSDPIEEASAYILGFMGDSTLAGFIERLREFDGKAATYLSEARARAKAKAAAE